MQLHVSVMFNMHKKWSGSVVYAATETRVSRLNMFLPRFRLRILAISSCVNDMLQSLSFCLLVSLIFGISNKKN